MKERVSDQLDSKSWQDLDNPKGVDYLGLMRKRVTGIQARTWSQLPCQRQMRLRKRKLPLAGNRLKPDASGSYNAS